MATFTTSSRGAGTQLACLPVLGPGRDALVAGGVVGMTRPEGRRAGSWRKSISMVSASAIVSAATIPIASAVWASISLPVTSPIA